MPRCGSCWIQFVGCVELIGEQDNPHESPFHRLLLADQAVVPQAMRSRLGSLKGQFSVPDDFDRMGQEDIVDLFEGIAES